MKNKCFIILCLLLLISLFCSCASSLGEPLQPENKELTESVAQNQSDRTIVLAETNNIIYTGKMLRLKATVVRNTEDAPPKTKLVWSSGNTDIATVTQDGNVKGISGGVTEIRVTASDNETIYTVYPVLVRTSVSAVSIAESSISLTVGGEEALARGKIEYAVLPENAYNKRVSFSSSNPQIVDVDETGNLLALSAGKAVITVKSEDRSSNVSKSAKCNVVVNQAVTGIKLKESELNLGVGKTATIITEILPSNATQKKIRFVSSNEEIATVSEKGTVTGKSIGTCTITCTATDGSNVETTCNVSINKLAQGIYIKGAKENGDITINVVEDTETVIAYYILPEDATNQSIEWTSDKPSVATIYRNIKFPSDTLNLLIRKPGQATITLKTKDGSNKKRTIKVNVEPKLSMKVDDVKGYTQWGYHSFYFRLKNESKFRTIDGVTVTYSAVDVYGKRMKVHGFGDYDVEETLNITLKPGEKKKTKDFTAYGFEKAKKITVTIEKIHYSDGTTLKTYGLSWTWTYEK